MNETASRTDTFGLIAVLFGFVSFAIVVGHFFGGPIDPPPPIEVSIADKAVAIRDATVAALKGEEYAAAGSAQPRTLDDYLTWGAIGLAMAAILMAVIGFVRHERLRPSIAGAGLGALAISFQYLTMLFFALLFVLLVSAVLDKLDFGFLAD